jgi:hypothetical protein
MGSDMEWSLKIDMKANMEKGNRRSEPTKSYSGVIGGTYCLEPPAGFEPATTGLQGRRFRPAQAVYQLSYGGSF